jgi:hypothetical protein
MSHSYKPVHLDPNSSPIPIYVTIAATVIGVLLGESQLLANGGWLPFLIVIAAFTACSLLAGYASEMRGHYIGLIGAAITSLALIPLTNNFFLAPIITFITVSQAQSTLSPRIANLYRLGIRYDRSRRPVGFLKP